MIKVGEVLVSDDVIEARFSCDLSACKGACCRVGDRGAPLAAGEEAAVEEALPALLVDAPERSRDRIARGDVFERLDGKTSLACFPDGACVLSFPLPDGSVGCQLERAYRKGETTFLKPLFCHLFPVRLESFYGQTAVNLERRRECEPGFLAAGGLIEGFREPLTRALGEDWYRQLEAALPAARADLKSRR